MTVAREPNHDLSPDDPLHRLLVEDRTWVVSIARALVLDHARAEDLAHDAFVAALHTPPGRPDALRPWLRGVLRNLSRQTARAEMRRRAREERAAPPESYDDDPSDAIARLEIRQQVIAALLALDEPLRTAVVLRHLEGRPVGEIARRTDTIESTVRSRIQRGLERLRTHLDGVHGGDRDTWMVAVLAAAAGVVLAGDAGAEQIVETEIAPNVRGGTNAVVAARANPKGASPLTWAGAIAAIITLGLGTWLVVRGVSGDSWAPEERAQLLPGGGEIEFVATDVADGSPAEGSDQPGPIVIVGETEATRAVRVLDGAGSPVVGAEVSWTGSEPWRARSDELARLWKGLPLREPGFLASTTIRAFATRSTTDALGIARIAPPRDGVLQLVAIGEEGSAHVLWKVGEEPPTLTLSPAPRLIVVEPDGAPAAFAWVELEHTNLRGSFLWAVTDERGKLDLAEAREKWGEAHDWYAGPGFPVRVAERVVVEPASTEPATLVLPPHGRLTIRASAALLALVDRTRFSHFVFTTPIDDWDEASPQVDDPNRDRWSFPNDSASVAEFPRIGTDLGLHLSRGPQAQPYPALGPRAGEHLEIALDPDPLVVGIRVPVIDADAVPLADLAWKVVGLSEERSPWLLGSGQTSDDGIAAFTLRRDGSEPHTVMLYHDPRGAPADLSRLITVAVPPLGSPSIVTVAPQMFSDAPHLLAGVVLDANGGAIPDLDLEVARVVTPENLWPPLAKELRARTDRHGRFVVRGIPFEGEVELRIDRSRDRLDPAVVAIGSRDLELSVERAKPLTVTGRVVVPPDFAHWVRIRCLGEIDGEIRERGSGGWNADGTFSFRSSRGGDTLAFEIDGFSCLEVPFVSEVRSGIVEAGVIDLRPAIAEHFVERRFRLRDLTGGATPDTRWSVSARAEGRRIELAPVNATEGPITLFLPRTTDEVILHNGNSYARFDPSRTSRIDLRPAPTVQLTVPGANDARFERGLRCGFTLVEPFREEIIRVQTDGQEVSHDGQLSVTLPLPGVYDLEWEIRDSTCWVGRALRASRITVPDDLESWHTVELRWRD